MSFDYVIALTLIFSLLMLIIQRTERKYRRWVAFLILITAGLFMWNFTINREVESEAITALILSVIINVLFWWTIGRYNPVGNSDEKIQVLGMDD